VERFCQMSPEEIELLVVADGLEVDDAVYPPRFEPPRGPLRIRRHERGGLVLEVSPRRVPHDDFLLSILFGTGSCIFGGSYDLARFFRGTVAKAFGIECDPLPPRSTPEPPIGPPDWVEPMDEPEEPRERRPREARRRPSSVHAPRADVLAQELARFVRGQEVALGQVARAVATHLAKRRPARPESLLLVGPTGTGKTSAVEALPVVLGRVDQPDAHVFRVDCAELVHASDLRRILGAPPSYVGYVEEPPLFAALRSPGCILLLDEVEKASDAVHEVFLGLLDTGRLTAPDGETVEAPATVVAMTTNIGAEDLAYRVRDLMPGSREEQRACREHLLREGWPAELVGRIGTVAVFDELGDESLGGVAEQAIRSLAAEFGFTVDDPSRVLIDVVRDIADAGDIGARAFTYAARDLLAEAFADAAREGLHGRVAVDPGPPPRVVEVERSRALSRGQTAPE
jgi:hypothetical protein